MSSRDPLDDLLDHWRLPATAAPDLEARIRREIVAAGRQVEKNTWLTRLGTAFARPSFAFTFVAACILLGLFLAEVRVARLHAAYGAQIARSYVQLIDPLYGSNASAKTQSKGQP